MGLFFFPNLLGHTIKRELGYFAAFLAELSWIFSFFFSFLLKKLIIDHFVV